VKRLWDKIEVGGPDECWPWRAGTNRGYGRIFLNGRSVQAHRVVFFLTHGVWPPAVLHHCDNPPCCNPAHLFAGTRRDNVYDMVAKDRHVVEDRHPLLRIPRETVELIHSLAAQGVPRREIAERTGVSRSYSNKIIRGDARRRARSL